MAKKYETGEIDYDFAEELAPKDRGAWLISQSLADSRDVMIGAMDIGLDEQELRVLASNPAIVQTILDQFAEGMQNLGWSDVMQACIKENLNEALKPLEVTKGDDSECSANHVESS